MPDDNLKEILGFDPESGKREEDTSGLIENLTGKQLSEDVKNSFINCFDDAHYNFKVNPNQLAAIIEAKPETSGNRIVERLRCSYIESADLPSPIPLVGDSFFEDTNFRLRSEAVITDDGLTLKKHGEKATIITTIEPEVMVRPIQLQPLTGYELEFSELSNNSFRALKEKRTCEIEFNENTGRLQTFNYLYTEDLDSDPEPAFMLPMTQLAVSLANKDTAKIRVVGGNIIANRMTEDRVGISVYNNRGKVLDKFVIPLFFDGKKVSDLVDPQVLEDPKNAPFELDNSWADADFEKVVGIEWEQFDTQNITQK